MQFFQMHIVDTDTYYITMYCILLPPIRLKFCYWLRRKLCIYLSESNITSKTGQYNPRKFLLIIFSGEFIFNEKSGLFYYANKLFYYVILCTYKY